MYLTGCLYRDTSQTNDRSSASGSLTQFMTTNSLVSSSLQMGDGSSSDPLQRSNSSRTDFSKLSPNEISADSLEITNMESEMPYRVDGGSSSLSNKFYYQKKQFVWEFYDVTNLDPANRDKKNKIEIKFGDIKAIAIKAKDGWPGSLIIETQKPLTMSKEKNSQPGKNTQWNKAEDFTNGAGTPKENGSIKVVTAFSKDQLTKKSGGHSPLEKLLMADPELKKLIDANDQTNYDQGRELPEVMDENTEMLINIQNSISGFSEPSRPNYIVYDNQSGLYSQEYCNELCDKSTEELILYLSKILRPKKMPANILKKLKFKCPSYKCPKKANTDRELREHIAKKHPQIVDLGMDVLPSGEFRVTKKFLINVIMYAKSHPDAVRQAAKSVNFNESS